MKKDKKEKEVKDAKAKEMKKEKKRDKKSKRVRTDTPDVDEMGEPASRRPPGLQRCSISSRSWLLRAPPRGISHRHSQLLRQ